jgi:hypothetical protein
MNLEFKKVQKKLKSLLHFPEFSPQVIKLKISTEENLMYNNGIKS